MAILVCKECGGKVSDLAARCPHCGAPVAILFPTDQKTKTCPECGRAMFLECEECTYCGFPFNTLAKAKSSSAKKRCPSCGMKIDESSETCPNCGCLTKNYTKREGSMPSNASNHREFEEPVQGVNRFKRVVPAILAGMVCIIIMVILFSHGKQSKAVGGDSIAADTTAVDTIPKDSLIADIGNSENERYQDWRDKIVAEYGDKCTIIEGLVDGSSRRAACILVPYNDGYGKSNNWIYEIAIYYIDDDIVSLIYEDGGFFNDAIGADESGDGFIYRVIPSKDRQHLLVFATLDACSVARCPLYLVDAFNDKKVRKIAEGNGESHCLDLFDDYIRVEKWILKNPDAFVEDRDYYIYHEYYDLNGGFIRTDQDIVAE